MSCLRARFKTSVGIASHNTHRLRMQLRTSPLWPGLDNVTRSAAFELYDFLPTSAHAL